MTLRCSCIVVALFLPKRVGSTDIVERRASMNFYGRNHPYDLESMPRNCTLGPIIGEVKINEPSKDPVEHPLQNP